LFLTRFEFLLYFVHSLFAITCIETLSVHHTNLTVGPNAADFICWRREGSFETLATDCGDTSCPCCMENCCASDDCYADVDWDNIYNRASLVPRTKEGEDHD